MSDLNAFSSLSINTAGDEWDDLLLAPTSSGSSSNQQSLRSHSSAATSGSGEFSASSSAFNAFSFLGSAVSGGGRKQLFMLPQDSRLCLGSIGGSKFCIKELCNIPTHGSRKAKVDFHTFYLMENDSKVFLQPKLMVGAFADKQIAALIQRTFSQGEWEDFVNSVQNGIYPEWLQGEEPSTEAGDIQEEIMVDDGMKGVQVQTPTQADVKVGLFDSFPALSYDEEDDLEATFQMTSLAEGEKALESEATHKILKEFHKRFISIKTKWTKAFHDIEGSHLMVASDISKRSRATNSLAQNIGTPITTGDKSFTSVWGGINHVMTMIHTQISELAVNTAARFDNVSKEQAETRLLLSDTQDNIESFNERIKATSETITKHETRFAKILPILRSIQIPHPANGQDPKPQRDEFRVLEEKIRVLSAQVESLRDINWGSSLPNQTSVNELDSVIRDMKSQIQSLQLRIVGDGVQIGGMVFQCFDDVKSWVMLKFPIRRYGLFVDAVSLLDFFTCIGHVDAETSFSAFYNQQKSGFVSMYEARVAASIQNLFPMVFGRSNASGLDDSEFLPAIQDPDKWDNGITGLRYQIGRGMSDVEFQIESTIESVLGDYPEPRQIAKDCLYKAKRFVTELSTFISQDYQKWMHRGHSKKESWKMTTVCVRRIFEEIHSQRVVARDVLDLTDKDFSCAKYLWATWKAHEVMTSYVRHQFYEHPAIAAVLARHLADNHVKPDAAQGTKVAALEKAVKNINGRLDSIMASLEKEGKGKEGKGKGKDGRAKKGRGQEENEDN